MFLAPPSLDPNNPRCWKRDPPAPDDSRSGRKFGAVYTRRKRPRDDKVEKDRRFGISFVRRQHRKRAHQPSRSQGFGDGDGVLLVLVGDSSRSHSDRFSRFLVSILAGMRRKDVNLFGLSSFLVSDTISGVFSACGFRFLPLPWDSYVSCRNDASRRGICTFYGASASTAVPLVWLNFSAVPFYFKSVQLSMFPCFRRIHPAFARYHDVCACKDTVDVDSPEDASLNEPREVKFVASGMEVLALESSPCHGNGEVGPNEMDHLPDGLSHQGGLSPAKENSIAQNDLFHMLKIRKHHRKKRSSLTSLRSTRVRSTSSNSRRSLYTIHNSILKVNSARVRSTRSTALEQGSTLSRNDSVQLPFSGQDHAPFPALCSQDLTKSATKQCNDLTREMKSVSVELKKNIDDLHCTANLLVIGTDRCWREEDAHVMLEFSDSKEWCLGIKSRGCLCYLHRPRDMRPCSTNRYTHAMIWFGENGWKLEFTDKMEWIKFKELHKECSERNSQELVDKKIPVPGVQKVPGYEEVAGNFVRPEFYITSKFEEVERVQKCGIACYDMDSGDEDWLKHVNSNPPVESAGPVSISEDAFEKMIFSFEKAAYNNFEDVSDPEKAVGLLTDFGSENMVAAVFGYWQKKRKQKRAPLVRVFQESLRKASTQKPILRKRRSLKRQGSQGRGKPENYLQVGAKQEELRRVREAEIAANKAVEVAIKLRGRVQILMSNADLAAYKASMAVRLAESIQEPNSADLASTILD